MVILGSYVKNSGIVKMESIFKTLEKTLTGRKQKLIAINKLALKEGAKLVKE